MDWLAADGYWTARWLLERLLGVVYLVAFVSTAFQLRALLGARGLTPVGPLARSRPFLRAPTIFRLHYSDRFATSVAVAGAAVAALVVAGLPQRGPLWACMLTWFVLWALYLSFVNLGSPFYGFVWESLLLEAGALAVFLGNETTAPPLLVVLLFRWLLFRLEVGAGLIKIRNDPAWRDLTALAYHHETQPIPGPFSWYVHHLPGSFHKLEVAGNHLTQLLVPFLLFTPQPFAGVAGLVVILTQCWLLVTGNFAWLNALAIALATTALPGTILDRLVPFSPPELRTAPLSFDVAVVVLTAGVAVLSYWPVRNMVSRQQVMNATFNPLHFVNTYGLFGRITRERYEVVIEGTDDPAPGPSTEWKEYEFKAKPGDPRRRPPQVAPYHLRLDWMMWFAAISAGYARGWFVPLVVRLLEGDPVTMRLLRRNPFPHGPPAYVRARLYRYRFTTREERRATGAWWDREPVGTYHPAVTLDRRDPTRGSVRSTRQLPEPSSRRGPLREERQRESVARDDRRRRARVSPSSARSVVVHTPRGIGRLPACAPCSRRRSGS